ncbi:MAG: hypothetical protein WA700_06080 [Acidobacteriaceae bacterium]
MTTFNETLTLYAASGKPMTAYLTEQRSDRIDDGFYVVGVKYAHLADGTALSFVDDNTFRNLCTEELLHLRR